MTHDDKTVERVARAVFDTLVSQTTGRAPKHDYDDTLEDNREAARELARAALSAMPPRERPANTIPMPRNIDEAKAMVLIGENMLRSAGALKAPGHELLREALEALTRIERELSIVIGSKRRVSVPISIAFESARAAADKIRAALEHQQKGKGL